ncbi:Rv3235 family protein [Cnuibacter sp. UC19_7]|uniref:Rv3235 family protein n=1 Tax=Cnuibacter sp. UC19_7 TaxID=3350166 RepID=UPI00366A6174
MTVPPVVELAAPTLADDVDRLRASADDDLGDHPGAPPDARVFAQSLARCVVEVLAGTRALDQLGRWLSDDVYEHLLLRDALARRARASRGEAPTRLALTMGSTVLSEAAPGLVDAVVIVHGRARSRAVALRLEWRRTRWRATAVHVL